MKSKIGEILKNVSLMERIYRKLKARIVFDTWKYSAEFDSLITDLEDGCGSEKQCKGLKVLKSILEKSEDFDHFFKVFKRKVKDNLREYELNFKLEELETMLARSGSSRKHFLSPEKSEEFQGENQESEGLLTPKKARNPRNKELRIERALRSSVKSKNFISFSKSPNFASAEIQKYNIRSDFKAQIRE
jgi:hypothetical protein